MHFSINSVDSVTSVIQLALAPVFLLSAVATLITAITARLARNVDRMRFVQNELANNHNIPDVLRAHYEKEFREYKTRGRLGTGAIFFDVLSGVLVSMTVLELFLTQAIEFSFFRTSFVIITFVLGLLSFMVALTFILIEVVYAHLSASWDVPS